MATGADLPDALANIKYYAPVLLCVQTVSGHGGGTTLAQSIDQHTEILAFRAHALGLPL